MLVRPVTNSERSCFACERKWGFSYLDGLTSFDAAAPLRGGGLWHLCMAANYRSLGKLSPQELPMAIATQVIDPWLEQREHFVEQRFDDTSLVLQRQAEDKELAQLFGMMFTGYARYWTAADIERFEVIAVEPEFARAIPHPFKPGKWIEDRPVLKSQRRRRRWVFAGAVDLVVRDKLTGLIWIVEHKTTAERNLDAYARKLHWDPQVRGYAWALSNPIPELSTIKEPLEIAGVLYNVARKKAPAMPEPIKDGSRLSKAQTDTTVDVYKAAIMKHGFDVGDYEEMLRSLPGWEAFFSRDTYPLTERELRDFEVDLAHQALMMKERSQADYHPRQVQVCTGGVKALGCDFSDICIEDGNIARARFRVKTIRHEELKGELADPTAAVERGLTLAEDGAPGRHPGREPAEVLVPLGPGVTSALVPAAAAPEPEPEPPAEAAEDPWEEDLDSDDPWSDIVAS
jgi:hypothetical protein